MVAQGEIRGLGVFTNSEVDDHEQLRLKPYKCSDLSYTQEWIGIKWKECHSRISKTSNRSTKLSCSKWYGHRSWHSMFRRARFIILSDTGVICPYSYKNGERFSLPQTFEEIEHSQHPQKKLSNFDLFEKCHYNSDRAPVKILFQSFIAG